MSSTVVERAQMTGAHRVTSPQVRKYRPDIQGLRAVAVLLVVLYHAGLPGITGGYVGVDVFFVISGYLITGLLYDETSRRGRVSFVGFYARRARRLLPPVVLVVVASLTLARFVLPYTQLRSFLHDTYYAAFYGVNYHFAAEGVQYQNATAPPSPLQHFWSLAVEEQFYLLWPALIVVCAFLGRSALRKPLMTGVIAALSGFTLFLSITTTARDTSTAYFSLQTRAWELGVGALVSLTAARWAMLPAFVTRLLGWGGLLAIAAAAVMYDDRTPYPGSAALVPVMGAAALIGAAVVRTNGTPETVLLEHRSMQYIGRTSYAWYLWHWPMLILLPAWAGRALNLGERMEVIVLAFWFAVLTYFLENASHRAAWSSGKWLRAGVGLSGVVALAAAIVSANMPTLQTDGKAIQPLVLASADSSAVHAAVARSLSIESLPINLTPTLSAAQYDLPNEPAGCHAQLLDTSGRLCEFGDKNAARTAVLMGDSHAQQWLTPLSRAASANHWKIIQITKAACPIANVQFYEADLKRRYTECDAFRSWAAQQVARIRPDLIIASQSNIAPWNAITDVDWADRTVAALTQLAAGRSRFAYIGDTPTTSVNTLTCLQQHIHSAGACAYQRSAAFEQFPQRYAVLAAALKASGAGYVDTLDWFCTAAECPAVVDNLIIHRDQGHITDVYATWLEPMLAPIFTGGSK